MMKKALLVGFIATGFAVSAEAGSGLYAGLSAGIGGMDTKNYSNNSNPFSNVSLRSGAAYRAALGYLVGEGAGYGVEVGYTGYPKNIYKNSTFNLKDTYTGSTIDVLAISKYSSNSGFFLLGKAGVARVYQKVHGTFEGSTQAKSTNEWKPEAALGLGYDVTNSTALDVTFSHIFASQANPAGSNSAATRTSSVSTLMAGVTISFS